MKYKGVMIGSDLEFIPIENVRNIDIEVSDKMVRMSYVEVKGDMRKSTSATFPFDDFVMVPETEEEEEEEEEVHEIPAYTLKEWEDGTANADIQRKRSHPIE